jgi:ATP/maltotriose-dependent transcriptional regulator MalT
VSDWNPDFGAEILRSEMAVVRTVPRSLIGRSEDLAALDAALEQARGGDPVTVLVAGDAGMGKTRLVQEFCERAYAEGARVLTGSCVGLGESALPYAAVADALRAAPAEAYLELTPALRRELATLIPEAVPDDEPYESTQGRLFAAVLRLLEQLGRHEPVVLVLEDVHWADPSTRDMLRFLARGLRQTAVLLVLTHRTDEVPRDHPVRALLAELQRAPRAQSRTLEPLTRRETGSQLASLSGAPVEVVLADAIHERSEGNPLFSEELLATGAAAHAVPASLRDALLARLDRLPPDAQGIARIGSALGRKFDHGLLSEIAGVPDHDLDAALRACVSGHVLVVDDEIRGYRFRHALLQEVAGGELLPGERARLHRRIADALEARPTPPASAGARRLAEVAHHRLLAQEPVSALRAALEAARGAEDVHAPAEASRCYDVALELWDAVDPAARPTGFDLSGILERAGICRSLGYGDAQASRRLLERALAELGEDAPPLRRADLLSQIGDAIWRATANPEANLAMQEQALALLDGAPNAIAARIKARRASILMILGDFTRSEREAAEAVEIARAVGAGTWEADALITQFVCTGTAGDEEGTRALIEQARGQAMAAMDGNVVRRFFANSAFVLHGFARYEEALATALEGIEAETRAGTTPHGHMHIYENAADLLCALGRPQDAADLLGDEDGTLVADTTALSVARAKIALLQGNPRAAEAYLSAAGDIPGLADQLVLLVCLPLAEAALWNGHVDVALDACARGEAALIEEDRFAAAALLAVAVRAQADGVESGVLDLATARAEADRLLARVEPLVVTQVRLPEPDAQLVSAIAERSRLNDTPDPAAWQAATEAWAALGRGYEAAHAGWRWAQAIAATHGERDQLTCVLLAAHERATRIGSDHLVDAIESLARRSRLTLPGMADSDGSAFPDLTPRERDVLALVADGRTNRQIAQELFITDTTASVHVSNILGKLGASNRGEAAALAHKAGFTLSPE